MPSCTRSSSGASGVAKRRAMRVTRPRCSVTSASETSRSRRLAVVGRAAGVRRRPVPFVIAVLSRSSSRSAGPRALRLGLALRLRLAPRLWLARRLVRRGAERQVQGALLLGDRPGVGRLLRAVVVPRLLVLIDVTALRIAGRGVARPLVLLAVAGLRLALVL